jgi:hypothetical protein
MEKYIVYHGVTVYRSANTHPGAKTRSFVVLSADDRVAGRFRYIVNDIKSLDEALCNAYRAIRNLNH